MRDVRPWLDVLLLVLIALDEPDWACRHAILCQLSSGYLFTTDPSMNLFVDDLMDIYPEAHIILNLWPDPRCCQAALWAKSINKFLVFFCLVALPCLLQPAALCVLILTVTLPHVRRMGCQGLCPPSCGGGADWMMADFYEWYNAWVRREAAWRGRVVFEFSPNMGWQPICEFVGWPSMLPSKALSFLHLNDARQMRMLKRAVIVLGLVLWVVLGLSCRVLWVLVLWGWGPVAR